MRTLKQGFIKFDFCNECKNYNKCKKFEYGIELLEKIMILKALSKDDGCIVQKNFEEILNNLDIDKKKVEEFLEDKKKDCIYFN